MIRLPPCRHCARAAAGRARGLCSRCYRSPAVRGLYQAMRLGVGGRRPGGREPTDDELDAELERELAAHPLWRPCPYWPTDPRYNAVVAAREAAGLPARHPGDVPPGPD